MRISNSQRKSVLSELTRQFGTSARIWLFGSRVDDYQHGGDVDLYVEAANLPDDPVKTKIHTSMALEDIFDGASVDLIIRYPQEKEEPIQAIARKTGVRL